MELTEQALQAQLRDVDDLHRDGMATMPSDIRDLHAVSRHDLDRRRLLRTAALAGAAVTVGNMVLPLGRILPASAADAPLDDPTIAAFAASIEYAAVEAYAKAGQSGKVSTPSVGQAVALFAGHHKEHGDAFLSASGGKWTKDKSNPALVKALSDQLAKARTEKEVVKLAFDTENAAAATYLFALGALTGADALKLTASILPIESAHAVVLGGVLGLANTDDSYLPAYESQKLALSLTAYPLA